MPDINPLFPGGVITPDYRPSIAYFPADPSRFPLASVVVLPGGGYGTTAPHEGDPVALWLNSLGIAAFVVRYRVAPHTNTYGPLQDAARAIRHVRASALSLDLDPNRVGVLGFSAGGHLAASISNHYDSGNPDADNAVERESSRPDLSILIYPVISFKKPYVHQGSMDNLIGTEYDPALVEKFSLETQVTANTPPSFLVHSADDEAVPFENSLIYATALHKANVPVELHVYEDGGHGYGLGGDGLSYNKWPSQCALWLEKRGFTA